MKRFIYAVLLLSILSGLVHAQEGGAFDLRTSKLRWIVKFDAATVKKDIDDLAASVGAEAVNLGPYADFFLFKFLEAPDQTSIDTLLSSSAVIYAEREARYRTTAHYIVMPEEDPLKPLQWAHRMINLKTAHQLNFGSDPSVTIAVLDTGVAYVNSADWNMAPDLSGTIVYTGYDFVSEDNLALDEGDGALGHGTFLSGVIAQTTYNAYGSSGIAFNSAILPVRVVNRRGLSRASDLARGIRYAVANGSTMLLLGVAGPVDSRAVREAIDFAYSNGVAVIAPAGNYPETLFPARYDQVFSVGAVDAAGERAHYSPASGPVDIYAPGGDLREGVDANFDGNPDGIIAESFVERQFSSFSAIMMEGTSAAAAHVAGTAALLISHAGPMPPAQLYKALRNGARTVNGLSILDATKTLMRSLQFEK